MYWRMLSLCTRYGRSGGADGEGQWPQTGREWRTDGQTETWSVQSPRPHPLISSIKLFSLQVSSRWGICTNSSKTSWKWGLSTKSLWVVFYDCRMLNAQKCGCVLGKVWPMYIGVVLLNFLPYWVIIKAVLALKEGKPVEPSYPS